MPDSVARNVWVGFLAGLLSGALVTFVAGLATVLAADWIAEKAAEAAPTCTDPRGLKPIENGLFKALGPQRSFEGASYPPDNVNDGCAGSIWVPPLVAPKQRPDTSPRLAVFHESEAQRTLELRFRDDDTHDVRLVCVANGLGSEPAKYLNWGRVKTVMVWGDDHDDTTVTVLQSLGDQRYQELQRAARAIGETHSVFIRLDNAHSGSTVEFFDVDNCLVEERADSVKEEAADAGYLDGSDPRYVPGCTRAATAMAGLSEVILYEPEG